MIITDFNEMSVTDLAVINYAIGLGFVIEGGRITGTVNDNAHD